MEDKEKHNSEQTTEEIANQEKEKENEIVEDQSEVQLDLSDNAQPTELNEQDINTDNEQQVSEEVEGEQQIEQTQTEEERLKEEKKKKRKKRNNIIFFTIISVILVFTVVYSLLYSFCFTNIYVSGASMENTLNSGDYVVANKNKKATYGDIVVIKDAGASGSWIIKRVIAMGGDHVWIISQDPNPDNIGVWLLKAEDIPEGTEFEVKKYYNTLSNYTKLEEPYAKGITTPNNNTANDRWDNIREDQIFYLGDNRQNSSDARNNGCCTTEQIVGVVENWSLTLRPVRNLYYTVVNWIAGLFGGSCVSDSK